MTEADELFERKLIQHCTPVLAGIKPANLFTFCYDVCSCHRAYGDVIARQPVREQPCHKVYVRKELLAAFSACRAKLRRHGVRMDILAWRRCGPLVFVYRPALLAPCLASTEVAALLARFGYETPDLGACVNRLRGRVRRSSRQAGEERCSFPHEIGLFLGYPAADVEGFVEHRGQGCVEVGCWRVYGDAQAARRRFERFRSCTAAYECLYDAGVPLAALVTSRPAVALPQAPARAQRPAA